MAETDGDGDMKHIDELLEQHETYDCGGGWTISKTVAGRWGVYFRAKAADAWKHEFYSDCFSRKEVEIMTYQTAMEALRRVEAERYEDWYAAFAPPKMRPRP